MDLERWETEIKKGTLEMIILALLKSKEKYGLEIIDELKEVCELDVAEGTLYPIFNRLKDAGLVLAKWETTNVTGHPRKYYTITPKGKQTLETMLTTFRNYSAGVERVATLQTSGREAKGCKRASGK